MKACRGAEEGGGRHAVTTDGMIADVLAVNEMEQPSTAGCIGEEP